MGETDGVSAHRTYRLRPALAAAAVSAVGLVFLCGCAGSTTQPNAASSASVAPGAAPTLGDATQGDLSVNDVSIQRDGTKLAVTATIHNSGPTADQLTEVGSQVSPTLTLTPALAVPAGGTVALGGPNGTKVVLDQQGRLEPGGTVDLILQFQNAGQVQVFSSFTDKP
jgi:hypothetical protein